MSDMLLQIYTRHERADVTRKYVFLDVDDGEKAHEDREWLLTEVERQRAEIKRLRADLATQQGCCDGAAAQDAHIRREREEHRAEVEKLRASNKRLRENVDRAGKEVERADRLRAEIARVKADERKNRAEIERLRDVLRRVVVYPSGDKAARVAFVSVGCQVSFPLHPQTTGALELLVEFDQARRNALEGKP